MTFLYRGSYVGERDVTDWPNRLTFGMGNPLDGVSWVLTLDLTGLVSVVLGCCGDVMKFSGRCSLYMQQMLHTLRTRDQLIEDLISGL